MESEHKLWVLTVAILTLGFGGCVIQVEKTDRIRYEKGYSQCEVTGTNSYRWKKECK